MATSRQRQLRILPGDSTSCPARQRLVWPLRAACTALAMLLAGLGACSQTPSEADPPPYVPHSAPQLPTTAIPEPALPMQWWHDTTLNLSQYTPARMDTIAQCAVAAFQLRLVLSPEGAPRIAELRARNPKIVIVGIQEVLSCPEVWSQAGQRERFPLSGALYDVLSPHRAMRTDGQLATMWLNAPMVNPWSSSGYNLDLLRQMMDVISDYASLYPGTLDAVFHDYTSSRPWIYPTPADRSIDVDLDGDGVGAAHDPDDTAAWVGWQHKLVEEWQNRCGAGLIQIANGSLPHSDAIFAHKVAGIHYEEFPSTVWYYSDLAGMDLMLGHLAPGYLTPRRGRVWSEVMSKYPQYQDLCRLTSMLAGVGYSYWTPDNRPMADTIAVDPGLPLGSMQRIQQPDNTVRFQRPFERGQVLVDMWSWGTMRSAEFVGN
jgi:hypothetical protein